MLFVEATAVEAIGRITPGCLGLYSDENERALGRVVATIRQALADRARDPARARRSQGFERGPLARRPADPARPTAAGARWRPRPLPITPEEAPPEALDRDGMRRIRDGFVALDAPARCGWASTPSSCTARTVTCCTNSCRRSPTAARTSTAASSRTGCASRSRCSRPCARPGPPASRSACAISATDWIEGGWDVADVGRRMPRELKRRGCDWIDCSSGGVSPQQKIPLGPGYQVPFARRIRAEAGIADHRRRPDHRHRAGRSDRRVGRCRHGRARARRCSTTRAGRGTPRQRSAARCTHPSSTGVAPRARRVGSSATPRSGSGKSRARGVLCADRLKIDRPVGL